MDTEQINLPLQGPFVGVVNKVCFSLLAYCFKVLFTLHLRNNGFWGKYLFK